MPDIIKLLPDAVANKIAAGEVVQRPASVVKETLENAVDAGASEITLIIKDAGKTLIKIVDNGAGMSDTDARMCFERHATSKINSAEDLFSVKTFGFRGEAMASIAAVAQVELQTKRAEDELGTYIRVEGSKNIAHEPVSCPDGTSISVKNLFFNVPARRNFLKSNPVELRHINDEFFRVALSHPEIEFHYFQNDTEAHSLKKGNLSKRIVQLFGSQYKENLVACSEETEHLKIYGYVGKPEFAKKTRGEQFFIVNNRFVKHHYLHHAVCNAYQRLISDDAHPFYVLNIKLDPKRIDINVHPTKTEIKFDDERMIYAIIMAAVKKSLAEYNVSPSIDFDANVNLSFKSGHDSPSNFRSADTLQRNKAQKDWKEVYDDFFSVGKKENRVPPPDSEPLILKSGLTHEDDRKEESRREESTKFLYLHQRYIITSIKSGILIIDQKAARHRILFEHYLHDLQKGMGTTQRLLFPVNMALTASDFEIFKAIEAEIRALGFEFEFMGERSFVLNGIPVDVQNGHEKEIIESLIEQFKNNQSHLGLNKKEKIASTVAQRTVAFRSQNLDDLEIRNLIDKLFACSNPNYAPDGALAAWKLGLDKLADIFAGKSNL